MAKHPFDALASEYALLWTRMSVVPRYERTIDNTARRLMKDLRFYAPVSVQTGVPIPVIMCISERESGGRVDRNLAQGDPLTDYSVNVPRGEPKVWHPPPFTFEEAAVRALQIDRLDRVAPNWSIARALYEMEGYNGWGYRDGPRGNPPIRSPYLWGGTNQQQAGKYIRDGVYDPSVMDVQLGVAPVLRRIMELDRSLLLPLGTETAPPLPSPVVGTPERDIWWLQRALVELGADPPLDVDGSYGRRTRYAVGEFQEYHSLGIDGIAGPITIAAIEVELKSKGFTIQAGPPAA